MAEIQGVRFRGRKEGISRRKAAPKWFPVFVSLHSPRPPPPPPLSPPRTRPDLIFGGRGRRTIPIQIAPHRSAAIDRHESAMNLWRSVCAFP
jgi:hypothetical protein